MAAAQVCDPELKQLPSTTTLLTLQNVPIPNSDKTILCDVSQGYFRPVVPSSLRQEMFQKLHSLSHPGIKASRHLVAQRYVWPNMKRDVIGWTRTCHSCQQYKIHRHVKAPLQLFPSPDTRFDSIHVDVVGPLPPFQGYAHLFTCVNR